MSETTDEFITAAWIVGAPVVAAGKWAGRKAYHGAQRAGMAYQNWRWGGAGDAGLATSSGSSGSSPAATGSGKWDRVTTSTTSYYHTESKWEKYPQEGRK